MSYRWYMFFYLLVVVILSFIYFTRNFGYAVDDSFITYRYAYHLKEGFGLVFNVGEKYYGTTAAGYAVLLAALSILGSTFSSLSSLNNDFLSDIPTISTVLAIVSIGSIAALLPTIICPRNNPRLWLLCLFGVIVLFITTPFNEVSGHETYAYIAASFIGVALIAYKGAYAIGAVCLALAVTFRPDAILFGGIVIFVDWFRSKVSLKNYFKRRDTGYFLVVYVSLLCLWFLLLAWHFGTFLPGTMEAKKIQVALGYWPLYSIKTSAKYIQDALGNIGLLVMLLGIVFWAAYLGNKLRIKKTLQDGDVVAGAWLLFALFSASAYFTFNVTFWRWYGVPLVFSILVTSFIGWGQLLDYAESVHCSNGISKSIKGLVFTSLPLILLITPAIDNPGRFYVWAKSKNTNAHIYAYSEIIKLIRDDSPGGAIIQMPEPGSFGYHLGPKYFVVDELGLITPGVAAALGTNEFSWALKKWHPDYLICSWPGSYSACFHDLQREDFVLIGEFNHDFWRKHLGRGAQLYKRIRKDGRKTTSFNAFDHMQIVKLGDLWGKADKGSTPQELFLHPGASQPTIIKVSCGKSCDQLDFSVSIAKLPKEAPHNAGSVGVTVQSLSGIPLSDRLVIDRQHTQQINFRTKDSQVLIKTDNNGDPNYDWLILRISNKF